MFFCQQKIKASTDFGKKTSLNKVKSSKIIFVYKKSKISFYLRQQFC